MDAMDIEDIDDEMPFKLIEHAKAAALEILPEMSREKYNRVYRNFLGILKNKHWKKYKITLWSFHSMLKATLRANEDIDICYKQVPAC